jgi:glycosyltransferase involved in cell wall biosynthesis
MKTQMTTISSKLDTSVEVTVIIPTRNRPAALLRAVESVVAQKMGAAVETIIINDGDRFDDCMLSSLAEIWVHSITVIEPEMHLGPAGARNAGIDKATGRYLAFLDDDDIFLVGHLSAALEQIEQTGVEFVYMGALVSEDRLTPDCTICATPALKKYAYDPRLLQIVNYIHTSAVVVRSFRDTPVRFDRNLSVCEDWDMWLSLVIKLGFAARYGNQVTSVYHQIPEERGMVAQAQQQSPSAFTVARHYIYEKWPSQSPTISEFRAWMILFESARDRLIAEGTRMPNLLFDSVLVYISDRLDRGLSPNAADIAGLFA